MENLAGSSLMEAVGGMTQIQMDFFNTFLNSSKNYFLHFSSQYFYNSLPNNKTNFHLGQ
jgi:hypothetical protein